MSREARYAVKFVGYSAEVIARGKFGRDVVYAMLDFVSGAVSMFADEGWVMVSNRSDLEPFLKGLPKLANEIQDRLRKGRGEFSQQSVSLHEPWDRLGELMQSGDYAQKICSRCLGVKTRSRYPPVLRSINSSEK